MKSKVSICTMRRKSAMRKKSTMKRDISIFILGSLFLLVVFFTVSASAKMVYVRGTQVNVRKGPGKDYKIVTTVRKGEKFELMDESRNWVKVRLSDKRTGWIYKNLVSYSRTVQRKKEPAIKRQQYRITVLPFANPEGDLRAGNIACDALVEKIFHSGLQNIYLVEREELKKILQEQKLSLQEIVDLETAIPAGKIKGVNMVVLGKVLQLDVETSTSKDSRTKTYRSGYESKRNHRYIELERKIRGKKEEMEDRKSTTEAFVRSYKGPREAIPRIIAQANESIRILGNQLSRLQSELSRTSEYIQEPVYNNWPYVVLQYRKVASCRISYRVIDTATGKVLKSGITEKESYDSDEVIENSNPSIGLYADPLEIISDTEMKTRVLNRAIDEVASGLISFITDLSQEGK